MYAFVYFSEYEMKFAKNIVRWCVGVFSIFLFMFLRYNVYPIVKDKSKQIIYFGKNSFWIYLVHQPFVVSGSVIVLDKIWGGG